MSELVRYVQRCCLNDRQETRDLILALQAMGITASAGDIARAYSEMCEISLCAGWLPLSDFNGAEEAAGHLVTRGYLVPETPDYQ